MALLRWGAGEWGCCREGRGPPSSRLQHGGTERIAVDGQAGSNRVGQPRPGSRDKGWGGLLRDMGEMAPDGKWGSPEGKGVPGGDSPAAVMGGGSCHGEDLPAVCQDAPPWFCPLRPPGCWAPDMGEATRKAQQPSQVLSCLELANAHVLRVSGWGKTR